MWRFGISFTYLIETIESKFISVYLINDYSLIADLHIFVYGRAECATISLECTKVKLLIWNNFGRASLNHFSTFFLLNASNSLIFSGAQCTSLWSGDWIRWSSWSMDWTLCHQHCWLSYHPCQKDMGPHILKFTKSLNLFFRRKPYNS